ncbi:MAG: hypothetical protein ACTSV2_00240 [Candidatus Thorarchaeota archaeon]
MMTDMSDLTKTVVNEEERKRLINEITRIKEVLDSFKYGLNFEKFADEIFKTIDRQTISTKNLESKMDDIIHRMERLESAIDEGIKVRVSGLKDAELGETDGIVIEKSDVSTEDEVPNQVTDESKDELEREAEELQKKIAVLFEKENELLEMGLNDPAGAEEYDEKAAVAREMRNKHKKRLAEIKAELE